MKLLILLIAATCAFGQTIKRMLFCLSRWTGSGDFDLPVTVRANWRSMFRFEGTDQVIPQARILRGVRQHATESERQVLGR